MRKTEKNDYLRLNYQKKAKFIHIENKYMSLHNINLLGIILIEN